MVAVDRRSAVVDEGSDTAGNIPVAISRALVCVVEEAVVCVFFVRRRLRNGFERVVNGAFEGGHLGGWRKAQCVLRKWVVVKGSSIEKHEMLRWQCECVYVGSSELVALRKPKEWF